MEKKPITSVVIFSAKEGFVEQVRESLLRLSETTLQEEGCISYLMHEDVDTPGRFMCCAIWKDRAAFDNHMDTHYYKEWMEFYETKTDILFPKAPWVVIDWEGPN